VQAVASEGLVPRIGRWRPNPWKMLSRLEHWIGARLVDRERCGRSLSTGLSPFVFQGLQTFSGESMAIFRHAPTDLEFVLVPGDTYDMGSSLDEEGRRSDERVHSVTLDPFLIARTVVTQVVWQKLMDSAPSYFVGDRLPVESITWSEADAFCSKVGISLPTEAQWEYACRVGAATPYGFGAGSDELDAHAWHRGNSDRRTHPVAAKAANVLGLHDTHGGVWEWCADGYSEYPFSAVTEPIGPDGADYRVFRGGSWSDRISALRCAQRGAYRADHRAWNVGFRPALRVRKGDLANLPPTVSEMAEGTPGEGAAAKPTRDNDAHGDEE
jgi:formylglycine-generating enzyme required for sulfatase activity